MKVELVEVKKQALCVEKTLFDVHYNEQVDKSNVESWTIIVHDLILNRKNNKSDEAKAAKARHQTWLNQALASSSKFIEELGKRDT